MKDIVRIAVVASLLAASGVAQAEVNKVQGEQLGGLADYLRSQAKREGRGA